MDKGAISFQDSCFLGGASLSLLWEDGNWMDCRFTPNMATRKMVDDWEGGRRAAIIYNVAKPTVLTLLDCDINDVDNGSVGGIG